MKLSVVSLCALLSAIPASMALPEPGASPHIARETGDFIGTVNVSFAYGYDCPRTNCIKWGKEARTTKVLLSCATSYNTTLVNGVPKWAKVKDGSLGSLQSLNGKPIPGGVWYAIGNLTVEPDPSLFPDCNGVKGVDILD